MDNNHYYLHKISQERIREFLKAEEQHRMVKLVYPPLDKPHWAAVIMKKIKDLTLNLLDLRDRPSLSKNHRTGSFPKGSST